MTFTAVPIMVQASAELDAALDRARRAVAAGARLIEWRIDILAEETEPAAAVIRLIRESPAPCIVTCRPAWEGGSFTGDDADRIALFEAIAASDHQPRYLDVELAAFQRSANLRQKVLLAVAHAEQAREVETRLILSSHDFNGRPRDLLQRIERMAAEDACAVIKLAWHARSLRDNLEAFDLLAERSRPMIVLCMGEFGLMSRVLAPKFGGLLTFATDAPGEESAPGQPTLDELRKLYRFDSIGRDTNVYGVIGWPVAQSKSPQLHNAGFDAIGHDGAYLPLPVPPEYEHFKATVGAMIDHPRLDFRGASVTIPHKEHLLRFVRQRGGRSDVLTDRIGAANTIIVGSAGGLSCTNTDCPAAVEALRAGMGIERDDLSALRVAVLGAGGVARAVLAGLADAGASVMVFNRTRERAEALVEEIGYGETTGGDRAQVEVGEMSEMGRTRFDVYVNCTPIGMAEGADPDGSPLPEDVPLDEQTTVFDAVYSPARTPLIAEAEARGARVVTGLDMFISQAAMQFELWTGRPAPMDVFRRTLGATP